MVELGDEVERVLEFGFDSTGEIVGRKQVFHLHHLLAPPSVCGASTVHR